MDKVGNDMAVDGQETNFSELNEVLRLKEELESAKKQAERSSHAKSEFLSRMSHEMLTPMNAVLGMVQIAEISNDMDKIKNCLDEIGKASLHMVRLIKNVLDVAGGGRTITFESKEFAVDSMMDYVLGRINPEIESKNQVLRLSISEAIPDILVGDERRIAQVIIHLMTNASNYSPKKSEIEFFANVKERENGIITLQFDIIDKGIGIPKERHSIIFDIFEQMDGGLNRKHDGIGIGLALSKLIAEMMGGKLWFESEVDKGSKFSFTCKIKEVIGDVN